jgi:hypothetical protein
MRNRKEIFINNVLKLVSEYKEAVARDAQGDNGEDVYIKQIRLYEQMVRLIKKHKFL